MLEKYNNPWKGLDSYSYSDAGSFFGREQELDSLSESIRENNCTVLYGVSGVGKTSLITAGLCPRLEKEGFFPVIVHLDHESGENYCSQILRICREEISRNKCELESPLEKDYPDLSDANKLWSFFHASICWSPNNRILFPCVFIDPFEELFTKNSETPSKIADFFRDLNDAYQSIPSQGLVPALKECPIPISIHNIPSFRLVLSLREDFLSSLEDYCHNIPFLRQNRRRLNKMNGGQALDVIMKPRPGIVDAEAAKLIIAKATKTLPGSKELEKVEVDTPILSVLCYQLYNKAVDKHLETITSELVEAQGDDVLMDFYCSGFGKLSAKAIIYLENHLLTTRGFRCQWAIEDIDQSILSTSTINELTDARIIRREIVGGTARIEFSHDVLCDIAKKHRDSYKDATKARAKKAFSILRWVVVSLFGWLLFRQRHTTFFPFGYDYKEGCFKALLFNDNAFLFNSTMVLLSVLGFFIFTGLLYITSTKNKNQWLSLLVCIVAIGFFVFVFNILRIRKAYIQWQGTMALISITALIFAFSSYDRIDFKDAFRFSFSPKEIKSDERRGFFIAGLVFSSLFIVFRANLIKSVSLSIVSMLMLIPLHMGVSYMIGDVTMHHQERAGRRLLIIVSLAISATFFVMSTYSHIRGLSYALLLILFLLGLSLSGSMLYIPKRSLRIGLSTLFWLVLPLLSLGFSLFALGDNARKGTRIVDYSFPKYNRSLWAPLAGNPRFVPIVDRDGLTGLISNGGIVLTPQFYGIQDEYSIVEAEKSPYESWPIEQFSVEDSLGRFYSWDVRSHLGEENLLTRNYMSEFRRSPFGVISTRNVLSSLNPKIDTSRFDEYAGRLFLNELNYSIKGFRPNDFLYSDLTNHSYSFDDYRPYSLRNMLRVFFRIDYRGKKDLAKVFTPEEVFDSLLVRINRGDDSIPEYHHVSECIEAISNTSAFESKELCNNLLSIISAYRDRNTFNWRTHYDLAIVLLYLGDYEEAEFEARQAYSLTRENAPLVPLIEALLLQGNYSATDFLLRNYAPSVITKNVREYYKKYNGSTKRRGRPRPDQLQSYLGDLIVADSERYPFSEECLSYIHDRLAGYGEQYGCSMTYGQIQSNLQSLLEEHEGLKSTWRELPEEGELWSTLLCMTSSSMPDGRNWYRAFVRRGEFTSEQFDCITISDYPYPAVYFKNDKRGYIDLTGKELIPGLPLYDHAWIYSEGIAVVIIGDELLFIDVHGKVIARPKVKPISDLDLVFEDGVLRYRGDNNRFGLLGKTGEWVLSPDYDFIGESNNGLRVVKKDDRYGLVRNDGIIIVNPLYSNISVDNDYIRITILDDTETVSFPIKLAFSGEGLSKYLDEEQIPRSADDDKWIYYQVRIGDTLKDIALKNRVSVDSLYYWNGMHGRSRIRVGQRLKVGRRTPETK